MAGCPVKVDEKDSVPLNGPLSAGCPIGCTSEALQSLSRVGDIFPDARPAPGQQLPLASEAVRSNIPKSGEGESEWVYPSPQRFFNAMQKKGWQPREQDMNTVVAIHNAVNERCWQEVLQYEKFHRCPNPKLARFQGLPADVSPKAWLLHWTGSMLPYDRHDWTVDRCGTPVRSGYSCVLLLFFWL